MLPSHRDGDLRVLGRESKFQTAIGIKAGDTLFARGKDDGREYVLNIYTKSRRMAFSYRAPLPTKKDEWTEIRVPLKDSIPTAFSRWVQGMGPVEPELLAMGAACFTWSKAFSAMEANPAAAMPWALGGTRQYLEW